MISVRPVSKSVRRIDTGRVHTPYSTAISRSTSTDLGCAIRAARDPGLVRLLEQWEQGQLDRDQAAAALWQVLEAAQNGR